MEAAEARAAEAAAAKAAVAQGGAGLGWAEAIAAEVAPAVLAWAKAEEARPLLAAAAADRRVPQPNGAVRDPTISSRFG